MLAILLILASTLSEEIAETIGKKAVQQRRENLYALVFLGGIWGLMFLAVTALVGAPFKFSVASLPTLIPRVALEILLCYLTAESIIKAERSTMGFLRTLSIPMLLAVDIALGYKLSSGQIVGVLLMFVALTIAFHRNISARRGAGYALASAFVAVGTASLYKYNITHFNSVVAEQLISLSVVQVAFFIMALRHRTNPLRWMFKRPFRVQGVCSGLSVALMSFAFPLAPASVIITFKRTFALLWNIVFGRTYFHEKSTRRKLQSLGLVAVGLYLITNTVP